MNLFIIVNTHNTRSVFLHFSFFRSFQRDDALLTKKCFTCFNITYLLTYLLTYLRWSYGSWVTRWPVVGSDSVGIDLHRGLFV